MIQVLKKHGFVYDQFPAVVWAALIFISSSIPGITLPELKFVPADKLVHVLIYFVLCALVHRALIFQGRFPALSRFALPIAILLTTLFGASDEFHQSSVPNRVADVLDFAADSLGAFLFLAFRLIRWQFGKRPV